MSIKFNKEINLKTYHSFGIDSKAFYGIDLYDNYDVLALAKSVIPYVNKYIVLGSGSNVVFTDEFYDGVVVRYLAKELKIEGEELDNIYISVEAGHSWDEFVLKTLEMGYFGLENLSYIPGTVGASVVQNIGAYGKEVSSFVEGVECCSIEEKGLFVLHKEELMFGYRDSIFKKHLKDKAIVQKVIYKLSKKFTPNLSYGDLASKFTINPNLSDRENALALRDVVINIRKSKLPEVSEFGSAGSFFMNPTIERDTLNNILQIHPSLKYFELQDGNYICDKPLGIQPPKKDLVKLSAANLIDLAGVKEMSVNGVALWESQPLVLYNNGGAVGSDVVTLSNKIQEEIFNKFGITLQREVIFA